MSLIFCPLRRQKKCKGANFYSCYAQAKRMVKLSIIMVMEVLYRYIIDNM